MNQLAEPERVVVASRLRALRWEKGLSLEGLANRCGVSKSMLSKIERGESLPTVGAAVRIAAALSISLAHLLGIDEQPEVQHRAAAHQEIVADPQSGTTRYRLFQAGPDSPLQMERLVAPPGASDLPLQPVDAGATLIVVVTEGVLDVTIGDERWSVREGDSLTVRGPAAMIVHPPHGELAVAHLTLLRPLREYQSPES